MSKVRSLSGPRWHVLIISILLLDLLLFPLRVWLLCSSRAVIGRVSDKRIGKPGFLAQLCHPWLCDLGQVLFLLGASLSVTVKWRSRVHGWPPILAYLPKYLGSSEMYRFLGLGLIFPCLHPLTPSSQLSCKLWFSTSRWGTRICIS